MEAWWTDELARRGCVRSPAIALVELVAALLRIAIADAHATSVDAIECAPALAALTAEVADALADVARAEVIGEATWTRLIAILARRAATPRPARGALALALAHALDALFGSVFVDSFATARALAPGDAYPVLAFPAETLADDARARTLAELGARTGNPALRTPNDDRTRHLRIATDAFARYAVALVPLDPWLPPITEATRFAAAIPNQRVDEFCWRELAVDGRDVFYDVRPRDPDAQRRRLEAALAAARAADATLLVLPELAFTEAELDRLIAAGAFAAFPCAIAGSYHARTEGDAAGANVARVLAHGRELHRHHKFSDFHVHDRHEHLDRARHPPAITLLFGRHASLVVLICKDAMSTHVHDVVLALAPTVLAIPAMEPDCGDFERLAQRLAHEVQGFTVVASATARRGAIVGRPARLATVVAPDLPGPAVVVTTLDGAVQVIEITTRVAANATREDA